jgi:two-component system sensor histidine kinase TctE
LTLTQRLALLVVGLIAALLGTLGYYLERHLGQAGREALDEDLAGHATAIAGEIEIERGGELDAEDAVEVAGGHGFRIETMDGRVLFATTADWPSGGRGLGAGDGRDSRGTRYRIVSRRFVPEHAERLDGQPLVLRVAARSAAVDTLSRKFRTALLIALGIGLVAGGLAALGLARASLRPVRRLAGEVARIEATALDRRVDETGLPRDLRPLAAGFNGLLARVEAAFGSQRSFVARASHALRTPTTGILARADVALRRERGEQEYRAALDDVAALAREQAETINKLLAVMRHEDPYPARMERVRLSAIAAEARRLFEPRAAVAGLTLHIEVPGEATLVADRDALRELVDVLLDNAIRYTPSGGQVGLRVAEVGTATELEVWDTGPGIPMAERDHMFEPFQRGSAAEAANAAGTGLGLAIARNIATAHGATITIGDRRGGGTCVRLRFAERTSAPSR